MRYIYANPVIFWVPVAGVRWKWSSDPCLITETKQLENTVRCLCAQCRHAFYWHTCQSFADYLRKIDLVYVGADSITLKWFNKVLYKLRCCSMSLIFVFYLKRSSLKYRDYISVYLKRHPKAGRNTHLKKQPRAGQDTQHLWWYLDIVKCNI